MRARGDLLCYHEPFIDDYYLNRSSRVIPHHQPRTDGPVLFNDVCDYLMEQAQSQPVFLKDMSYYVVPHMFDRKDFFNAVSHHFLIRRPQASIASYYLLDAEINCHEIGYESQWQHYCHCVNLNQTPVVIEAEQVQQNPPQQMAEWWRQLGLEFKPNAFVWEDQTPQDWQRVAGWHHSVMNSTGIHARAQSDIDAENSRFEHCVNQRAELREYLNYHRPFYQQLGTAG